MTYPGNGVKELDASIADRENDVRGIPGLFGRLLQLLNGLLCGLRPS